MSKIVGPVHHGESGQIAGTVYYRQFGKQLSRSVPKPTTIPPTELQLNQRYGRFAPLTAFARQMKYAAKLMYQVQPANRTAFSQMVKQLSPAFTGTMDSPAVNLELSILGNGDLPIVPLTTCSETVPGTVVIAWRTSMSSPDEDATDKVSVMISTDNGKTSSFFDTGVVRSVGTASIIISSVFKENDSHCSSLFLLSTVNGKKSPFRAADPLGIIHAVE